MAVLTTDYQKIATGSTKTFGSAKGYLELYAKYNSQNISSNSTNYSLQVRLVVTSGYIGEYTGTSLTISGTGLTTSTISKGTGNFKSTTLGTLTGNVTHDSEGNKSITGSGSIKFSAWGITLSVSGSADLPKIARYTSITKFEVLKRDETSLSVNWGTSDTCDSIYYSLDNGSTWYGASGNPFVINSLNANSTYNVKIKVRRQDSQLWTESGNVQQTTYDYPHVTSTPDFIIGNAVYQNLYNPLNRTVIASMIGNDGSTIWEVNGWSGNVIGSNNTENDCNNLYKSIPNLKNGKYKMKIVYGSSTRYSSEGTYYINENNCIPTFNNFEFEDGDITVNPLKNNNQILVDNNSDCKFTISSSNKAIGKNSASIVKYICEWGNKSNEIAYSSSDDVSCYVYDSTGNTLKVTAVDSRGLSNTITKTITNIPYVNAVVNELYTERKDGIDLETYIGFKLTLWNGSWNASTDDNYNNRLKYVAYRVLINGAWSEYYDITSSVLDNIDVYSNGSYQTINLDISKKIAIHENGISGGFEVGKQFTIELLIKDGSNSSTFTPYSYIATKQGNVTDGKIGMSRYKDENGDYHYGVGCMPDDEFTLNVGGNFGVNGIPILDRIEGYGAEAKIINYPDNLGLASGFYRVYINNEWWFIIHLAHYDSHGNYARQLWFSYHGAQIKTRIQQVGNWSDFTYIIS